MNFHAYHGEFSIEHKFGQLFDVDVELFFDSKKAGSSDNLSDTIDIYNVYELVEQVMIHGERFNLIEALAEKIATRILQSFEKIPEICVRVRKHKPAVRGMVQYAEIEIKRCRKDV